MQTQTVSPYTQAGFQRVFREHVYQQKHNDSSAWLVRPEARKKDDQKAHRKGYKKDSYCEAGRPRMDPSAASRQNHDVEVTAQLPVQPFSQHGDLKGLWDHPTKRRAVLALQVSLVDSGIQLLHPYFAATSCPRYVAR